MIDDGKLLNDDKEWAIDALAYIRGPVVRMGNCSDISSLNFSTTQELALLSRAFRGLLDYPGYFSAQPFPTYNRFRYNVSLYFAQLGLDGIAGNPLRIRSR